MVCHALSELSLLAAWIRRLKTFVVLGEIELTLFMVSGRVRYMENRLWGHGRGCKKFTLAGLELNLTFVSVEIGYFLLKSDWILLLRLNHFEIIV